MGKKKATGKVPTVKPLPPGLYTGLREIESAIGRNHWETAGEAIRILTARYGRRAELLRLAVQVFGRLESDFEVADAARQLMVLEPANPLWVYSLVGANFRLDLPAQALLQLRHFLEVWPDHETAPAAQKLLDESGPTFLEDWVRQGLPTEDTLNLMAEFEASLDLAIKGETKAAIRKLQALVGRAPEFLEGWNRLTTLHRLLGGHQAALECSRRVLLLDGQNVSALADAVVSCWFLGDVEEARNFAAVLRRTETRDLEFLLKKAEAFAYLGDDEAIVEFWDMVEPEADWLGIPYFPYLLHVAATAFARLGQVETARTLWSQALEIDPDCNPADNNLSQFRRRADDHHAPWYLSLSRWMDEKSFRQMVAIGQSVQGPGEERVRRAFRKWVDAQPHIELLTAALLDRGDPMGSSYAWWWTECTRAPRLMEIARDFALGQGGTDSLRHTAALVAFDAGLLPETIRFHWQGHWREIKLAKFEVDHKPNESPNSAAQARLVAGHTALRDDRLAEAEAHYRAALEIAPLDPHVKNNWANWLILQLRMPEALAVLKEIRNEHPDFPFARILMAQVALSEGDVAEAMALLEPLAAKRRFHFTEFIPWVKVNIQLSLALRQPWQAFTLLMYWRMESPDDEEIDEYEMLVGITTSVIRRVEPT